MTEIDELAQAEVLLQLSSAFDHFLAVERRERKADHEATAEGAHKVSMWLLRSYAAERDDPVPADLP